MNEPFRPFDPDTIYRVTDNKFHIMGVVEKIRPDYYHNGKESFDKRLYLTLATLDDHIKPLTLTIFYGKKDAIENLQRGEIVICSGTSTVNHIEERYCLETLKKTDYPIITDFSEEGIVEAFRKIGNDIIMKKIHGVSFPPPTLESIKNLGE